MRVKLADVPEHADDLLPDNAEDASGVGVNYADTVLEAMKTRLDDGRKVLARRRGLQITLKVGDATGVGLLRRLEHGPDTREIFRQALLEAAAAAEIGLEIEAGEIHLLL